jgi:hypothetical protein
MVLMSGNFMYALLQAVGNAQNTESWQEISDATATINDAKIEQAVYSACNHQLTLDEAAVHNYCYPNGGTTPRKFTNASSQTKLQTYTNKYNEDSTVFQTYQSQADAAVQAAQTQSGQDGQNLANQAQLGQTMTSVLSTLASILQQHY